ARSARRSGFRGYCTAGHSQIGDTAMRFRSWLDGLKFRSQNRRARRARAHRPHNILARQLLSVETLEDRLVPGFLAPVNYGAGAGPIAIPPADFNHDGHLDLAVANNSDSTVSILLGNGDGTFQSAQNFGTDYYPRSIAVGDFDNDNTLDIVTANAWDLSILK